MAAPYSPAAIANSFLEKSGAEARPLTPMQLLKLVYIAHGWNLAVTGAGLIDEPVQAWTYGPVVPSLFHEFKRFGREPVTQAAHAPIHPGTASVYDDLSFDTEAPFLPASDAHTGSLLDWVWKTYGHMSGWRLSQLTHQPNTPWSVTMAKAKADCPGANQFLNPVIPTDLIRQHYTELWEKRNGR